LTDSLSLTTFIDKENSYVRRKEIHNTSDTNNNNETDETKQAQRRRLGTFQSFQVYDRLFQGVLWHYQMDRRKFVVKALIFGGQLRGTVLRSVPGSFFCASQGEAAKSGCSVIALRSIPAFVCDEK